jgi:hypothetical protein
MAIQYLSGINVIGNVGIGTTSPSANLEVSGASAVLRVGPRYTSGGDRDFIDLIANGSDTKILSNNERFHIQNNSGDIIINPSGNVGIGTTSPSDKLEVNGTGVFGTGSAYALKLKSSSGARGIEISDNNGVDRGGIDWSASDFVIRNASDANLFKLNYSSKQAEFYGIVKSIGLDVDGQANSSTNFLQYTRTDSTQPASISYDGTGGFDFNLNGGTVKFSDTNNGSVGIGTTSPGAKLDIYNGGGNATSLALAQTYSGLTIKPYSTVDSKLTFSANSGSTQIIQATNNSSTTGRQIALQPFGGNVGIGTTSPSQKLDVAGNIQATGSRRISAYYDANHYMQIESNVGGGVIKGTDGGVTTTLVRTYGDSYLNGGNLGIGTTSPQAKLHVANGALRTWTPISGTSAIFESTVNSRNFITIAAANEAEIWFGDASVQNRARIRYEMVGANMEFWTAGGQKMVINSSGNVGIGTTNPQVPLQVSQGVNNTPTIFRLENQDNTIETNQEVNTIQFYTNDSSASGTGISSKITQFAANPGNQYGLSFHTYDAGLVEAMKLTHDGKVGIGTTSPGYNLVVGDGTQNTESRFYFGDGSYTSASGYGLYMSRTFSYIRPVTDESQTLNIGALNSAWGTISNNALLHTFGKDSTEFMRINSSGDVGIGTTSPGAKLHVDGDARANQFSVGSSGTMQLFDYSGNLHIYSTEGTDILLGGGVGARQNDVTIGNGDLIVNGDIAADNFISVQGLDTGNPSASSEELRLSGYGFLGNRSAMYITNGHATGTLRFGAGGSGGNHGSNTKMVLNSSGNLGIGTTSPTKKLQISHSDANNGLLLEHTSEASGFQILQNIRQTEGLIWQKQTSGSFTSNLMTLGYDGDLGIGTTSPAGKLDVSGNIRASAGSSGGYEINTGYGVHGMKSYYGTLYFTTSVYAGGVNGISYKSMSASAFYVNSDYRLKSNVTALENAIERVKKLNVCRFNWKDKLDEEKVDGFIAHEVAEVIPEAVTGDKDAVREDGTLDPQQIDQSKVVPLLTAALKEAIEKIEQLENRIQTLENN